MIITAVVSDSAALSLGKGDSNLATLDLGAQIASSCNNMVPVSSAAVQPVLSALATTASFGLGIKQVQYCSANPAANLGAPSTPAS
jgi:hypothetical protein